MANNESLQECIGCSLRYAAFDNVDLCPTCQSDYEGTHQAGKSTRERNPRVQEIIKARGRVPVPKPGGPMGSGKRPTSDDIFDEEEGDDTTVLPYNSIGIIKEEKVASDNAHPNGELTNLIEQQRKDTSDWQNAENHSPNSNLIPEGHQAEESLPPVDRFMEESVTAKVFVEDLNDIEGGKVLLASGPYNVVGELIVDAEDAFAVQWRTGRKSIEKKANYELVVVEPAEEETEDA